MKAAENIFGDHYCMFVVFQRKNASEIAELLLWKGDNGFENIFLQLLCYNLTIVVTLMRNNITYVTSRLNLTTMSP